MKIDTAKHQLRELTLEINHKNFSKYYDKFAEVILNYRDAGGKGKEVYDYLIELGHEFEEDPAKEEVLIDTLNRLICFCPPSRHLLFPDFDQN